MKLADGRDHGILAAEHACMRLAHTVGLTTVTTNLEVFEGIEVLIVERYDRGIDPATGIIRRTHQEDACQALGVDIDAHQGRGKYERFGGPTFAQIAELLDRYGNPTTDHRTLLRTAVFTAAIGNADAHGKNISLRIDTHTGFVELAALYDTVPTALWPRLRKKSAMSMNGTFAQPSFDDFIGEARTWGLSAKAAERVIDEVLVDIRRAVAASHHAEVAGLVTTRLDAIEASRLVS